MSATILGVALAGLSAIGSSGAHAFLKGGQNLLATQAWSCVVSMLIALPLVLIVGLPEPVIVPWLIPGVVLHTVYYLVLIRGYSVSDYSLAYPIARGVVPIGTTLFGITLLGDQLHGVAIAGVVAISLGIMMLGLRRSTMSREGLTLAILAGVINTAFTLVDAKGLRVADNVWNFIVWYYVLDGFALPLLFALRNRGNLRRAALSSARNGIATGLMALLAYLPALIAYRIAPVGVVSAIRASSAILSMAFGGGLLGEAVDGRRITAAALVTAGACAIILGSQLAS